MNNLFLSITYQCEVGLGYVRLGSIGWRNTFDAVLIS